MKILESPLLGEFIAYLKANWTGRSRVDLRRRRLRQLVTKVRAVTAAAEVRAGAEIKRDASFATWLNMLRAEALRGERVLDAASCDAAAVAGSTRRFLTGMKELVVSSPDVDRLAEAVEELERLAGPGGDLDLFVQVLRLPDASRAAMDVDGVPVAAARPQLTREASGSGSSSQGSVLPVLGGKRKLVSCNSGAALPVPGAKRKIHCCCSDADGGSTSSLRQLDTIDHRKRRVLAWVRPQHWFPALGCLFAAPQKPPPPPAPPAQPLSARTVALAMARVRGRIGKPTRRRRQHPYIGQQLSRLSL